MEPVSKYIKNSHTSVITWQTTKLKSGQRENSGFSFNMEKGSHRANRHLKSGDRGIQRSQLRLVQLRLVGAEDAKARNL